MDFNKMINEMMAEGMDADAIAESFTKSLNAEMARQKAEAEKNSIAVEKRADMMEILLAIEDFLYDYYGDEMDILNAKDESFTPEDADKLIAELDNWFGIAVDLKDIFGDIIKTDKDEKHECKCHKAKDVKADKDGFSFSLNTDDIKDFLNALLG